MAARTPLPLIACAMARVRVRVRVQVKRTFVGCSQHPLNHSAGVFVRAHCRHPNGLLSVRRSGAPFLRQHLLTRTPDPKYPQKYPQISMAGDSLVWTTKNKKAPTDGASRGVWWSVLDDLKQIAGGERGIRTLDTGEPVYRISSPAHSTTLPSLRLGVEPRILAGSPCAKAQARRTSAPPT